MRSALGYDPVCLAHDNGSMVVDEAAVGWIPVAHAESADRILRAHAVLVAAGVVGRLDTLETRQATPEELSLVHTESHVQRITSACEAAEAAAAAGRPETLRAGTRGEGRSRFAGGLAGRGRNCAHRGRLHDGRRGWTGLLADPASGPPRLGRSGDGLLPVQQRGDRRPSRAASPRPRPRSRRRLGRPPRQRHPGGLLRRSERALHLAPPGRASTRKTWASSKNAEKARGWGQTSTSRCRPGPVTPVTSPHWTRSSCRPWPTSSPQLIVLSSGQDAGACDPLGRMSVTAEGFRLMTRRLVELVRVSGVAARGRIAAIQEGGYSIDHMPFCVLATVEALAGLEPALEADPVEMDVPSTIKPSRSKRSGWPSSAAATRLTDSGRQALKSTRLQSRRSGKRGRPSSGTGYQADA